MCIILILSDGDTWDNWAVTMMPSFAVWARRLASNRMAMARCAAKSELSKLASSSHAKPAKDGMMTLPADGCLVSDGALDVFLRVF